MQNPSWRSFSLCVWFWWRLVLACQFSECRLLLICIYQREWVTVPWKNLLLLSKNVYFVGRFMCRLNVHVFSLYFRVIFQRNFQHVQERLKCFVPAANNLIIIKLVCVWKWDFCFILITVFEVLDLLFCIFFLSWFTVWGILCSVDCGARQAIALWEGCVQAIASILLSDSSCFLYKFIQRMLGYLFLLSLFCDFVWLLTVNWDSSSSVLENSQWPNKLNQFSVWTRYSGWNVKKSEDTI